MHHARHPASNYDFAPVASLLGKYNTRDFEASGQARVEAALDTALGEIESTEKPAVPHTDPELIRGIQSFLFKTVLVILREAAGKVPQSLQTRVRTVVKGFNERMLALKPQTKMLCELGEIEGMIGLDMSRDRVWEIAHRANQSGKHWGAPVKIDVLEQVVTIDEVRRIFEVVKEKLFSVMNSDPTFYLDRPERHHLFWTPTETGQQCAVPTGYSMADYLRFHCPHNDAHLVHLSALPEQSVTSYCDFMDERAFFEAVAVYAEYQMLEAASQDSFVGDLYSTFSIARQNGLSKDQLQDWLLSCRGHEFHLRAVRLMGDLNTLFSGLPFEENVDQVTYETELPRDKVEAEVRKYYHLPGLGATYTLGFENLRERGALSIQDSFTNDGQVISTWHQS